MPARLPVPPSSALHSTYPPTVLFQHPLMFGYPVTDIYRLLYIFPSRCMPAVVTQVLPLPSLLESTLCHIPTRTQPCTQSLLRGVTGVCSACTNAGARTLTPSTSSKCPGQPCFSLTGVFGDSVEEYITKRSDGKLTIQHYHSGAYAATGTGVLTPGVAFGPSPGLLWHTAAPIWHHHMPPYT